MSRSVINNLKLLINDKAIPPAVILLQSGFFQITDTGRSIRIFLRDRCGIDNDYINKRITTRFLDSKPVDDIDNTLLWDRSTLALSGSLPGLVGAVLRAGSFYSSFRDSISHIDNSSKGKKSNGMVKVKLFNVIINDLGPHFFKKGIIIQSKGLSDFFSIQSKDFLNNCSKIKYKGKIIDPDILLSKKFYNNIDYINLIIDTI